MDIHQFFLGNAFDAYTFFGAHVQKDEIGRASCRERV